jgi:LemA protein
MGLMIVISFILLITAIAIAAYGISIYNGLVRVKNNIKKSWANIDVLLKQRSDELPKLIETVKGYMTHERETLENVTKARTQFMSAQSMTDKANADNVIHQALKSLFAVSENYPALKANENFLQLQSRISGLENEIADRREFYNDSVNTYNIRLESFPDMFVASMMKLEQAEMFKVAEEDKQDLEVKF